MVEGSASTTAGTGQELPSGTLTFLFTDIEGSTRLVAELGAEAYGEVLELHRRALRGAFESGGGIEIGTEGDSFFVVFTDPLAAAKAAAEGERALAATAWPDGVDPLRVRMGLHTGEATVVDGTYVGTAVNRAARVSAVAHGGQVVLSAATRAIVETHPPEGTRVRDLGEHHLKDLAEPERIAQLVVVGLPADFPPLRSLEAVPNNLPVQLTSFIGRDEDLTGAADLLRSGRLVTLTGPGGTGKTRLALQVAADIADRFPDGTWFVSLAPISDPALVATAIATALGVHSAGNRPIETMLVEHLRDLEALLVLDNFEQVVDAATLLADLLREAPRVRILVTSRIVLRIPGEQEMPVDALGRDEAIRLFVERAKAVRPEFELTPETRPVVAEIVGRLDGLPLAVELAAARSRILTPAAMLARLDRRLDLLAADLRGLPPRQRTIRGAIDWSYDLLDDDLRFVFARFAVFVGGARLDDAEEVISGAGADHVDVLAGLEALAEHSLIRRVDAMPDVRFTMLAVIREYALERLEATDGEAVRDRHGAHYLTVAEAAGPQLTGPDRLAWLERLDADHDNLRAALGHAIAAGHAASALRLCAAIWRFWQIRGYLREGIVRAREALAMPTARDHPDDWLAALEAAGGLTWWLGDYASCESYYRQALEVRLATDDDKGVGDAYYNVAFPTAFRGQLEAALDLALQARERYERQGDADAIARTHWAVGIFSLSRDDAEAGYQDAETGYRETLAAVEHFRTRDLPFDLAWSLFGLGQANFVRDDLDTAETTWGEALGMFHAVGDVAGVAMLLDPMAGIAMRRGDRTRAARLSGAVAHLERTSGAGLNPFNRRMIGFDPAVIRSDADLAKAWTEGEALTIDQAVAYALEGTRG